jgi:serine phosphatase RsbU (regulator of sigma subunit)
MGHGSRPVISVAVATHTYPGETSNGDGWIIDRRDNHCRIALIDGLGHGPEAAKATERARQVLATGPMLAPEAALHACHRELAGSRGAAIAIADIDPGAGHLEYAAVGNTEARLVSEGTTRRLIAYRGIVGRSLRTIRMSRIELPAASDWLLVLHTDGISQRFNLEDFPAARDHDAQLLADALLQAAGRPTDDATVIVALQTAR